MDDESLRKLGEAGLLHGEFTLEKAGLPASHYWQRHIFLDCRGPLKIHPSTNWGFGVMVLTQSHDIDSGSCIPSPAVQRPVTVDEGAWIGSRALLYNCHIEHHAIVACGAVVRNITVESYTIVEGNPARVVKRFIRSEINSDGEWVKVND